MEKLPTARTVKDVLGHVDIGLYRVARNGSDQQADLSGQWRVLGLPDGDGVRPILDEHDTYRSAVVAARRRQRELNAKMRACGLIGEAAVAWYLGGRTDALLDQVCRQIEARFRAELSRAE